jgi:hypothetical protein
MLSQSGIRGGQVARDARDDESRTFHAPFEANGLMR